MISKTIDFLRKHLEAEQDLQKNIDFWLSGAPISNESHNELSELKSRSGDRAFFIEQAIFALQNLNSSGFKDQPISLPESVIAELKERVESASSTLNSFSAH